MIEKSSNRGVFWHNATKYASTSDDESFVEEVAYMMVTLHRTVHKICNSILLFSLLLVNILPYL